MFQSHAQGNGTTQTLSTGTFGQKQMPQISGQLSLNIVPERVVLERKRGNGATNGNGEITRYGYDGPGQLNIEIDDLIFVERKVPGSNVEPDPNPFSSFNGLPMYRTAAEHRNHYMFMGFSMCPYSFTADAHGSGITVHRRGVANFVNKTEQKFMPGQWLTWEPIDNKLNTESAKHTKLRRMSGPDGIKARLVPYETSGVGSVGTSATEQELGALLKAMTALNAITDGTAQKKQAIGVLEEIQTFFKTKQVGDNNVVVGWNAEPVGPNEWGRIVLF
jgi:hypothetical protein